MDFIDVCSAAVAGIAFAAWCVAAAKRRQAPPAVAGVPTAAAAQRRRHVIAWEVRGLVLVVAGPLAAAMLAGYAPERYAVPVALGTIAGLLVAETIAPWSPERA